MQAEAEAVELVLLELEDLEEEERAA